MSCAGTKCSEKIQKSDIDKWTTSINQMLLSEFGRERFLEFLSDRKMDEAVLNIQFWEKCDAVQKKLMSHREIPRNELIRDLNEIVEFADVHINFSLPEMYSLRTILQERDSDKLCDIIVRAKTTVSRLLDRHHKIFSQQLLSEYKNRCH